MRYGNRHTAQLYKNVQLSHQEEVAARTLKNACAFFFAVEVQQKLDLFFLFFKLHSPGGYENDKKRQTIFPYQFDRLSVPHLIFTRLRSN